MQRKHTKNNITPPQWTVLSTEGRRLLNCFRLTALDSYSHPSLFTESSEDDHSSKDMEEHDELDSFSGTPAVPSTQKKRRGSNGGAKLREPTTKKRRVSLEPAENVRRGALVVCHV